MSCILFFYKLALCTKLSVLKLSQGISNKLGQRSSFMRVFALGTRSAKTTLHKFGH